MRKLSFQFPPIDLHSLNIEDPEAFVRRLSDTLEELRRYVAEVVNFNSADFVSQNAQPTVESGEMKIWKDTDATSGQPTHYIVYNDGTDTVTFASEEVVP